MLNQEIDSWKIEFNTNRQQAFNVSDIFCFSCYKILLKDSKISAGVKPNSMLIYFMQSCHMNGSAVGKKGASPAAVCEYIHTPYLITIHFQTH